MLFAFAVRDERLDVVIIQPRFVSHMSRFDPEPTAARLLIETQQRRPEQIIKGIPERGSSGLALALDPRHDIVVKRHRRSDAHDASILASNASYASPRRSLPFLS